MADLHNFCVAAELEADAVFAFGADDVFVEVFGEFREKGVAMEVGDDFGFVNGGDGEGFEGLGEDLGAADDEDSKRHQVAICGDGEFDGLVEVVGDFGAGG